MLRLALVVVQLLAVAAAASAQEPATRAEELAQQREEKSKELVPPQPGRLERALLVTRERAAVRAHSQST